MCTHEQGIGTQAGRNAGENHTSTGPHKHKPGAPQLCPLQGSGWLCKHMINASELGNKEEGWTQAHLWQHTLTTGG